MKATKGRNNQKGASKLGVYHISHSENTVPATQRLAAAASISNQNTNITLT